MDISRLFSEEYYIHGVEILTIIAILVLLGYFFHMLNVFKKD